MRRYQVYNNDGTLVLMLEGAYLEVTESGVIKVLNETGSRCLHCVPANWLVIDMANYID